MEFLEIVLSDFDKSEIDHLIFEELKISKESVASSHFYDTIAHQDLEFHQIDSLNAVFHVVGTGNIFCKSLHFGITLQDVLIIFSFNEQVGDLVFHFPENQLFTGDKDAERSSFLQLLQYLAGLVEKYRMKKVIFGYEPATDEDTMIVELGKDKIDFEEVLENENIAYLLNNGLK